jgi:hypothetical protein
MTAEVPVEGTAGADVTDACIGGAWGIEDVAVAQPHKSALWNRIARRLRLSKEGSLMMKP